MKVSPKCNPLQCMVSVSFANSLTEKDIRLQINLI